MLVIDMKVTYLSVCKMVCDIFTSGLLTGRYTCIIICIRPAVWEHAHYVFSLHLHYYLLSQ